MSRTRLVSWMVASLGLVMGVAGRVSPGPVTAGPVTGASEVFADQGWSDAERNEFYFTSQGSQLIPYAWLKALERAGGHAPFLDPQLGLARFGYLNDPTSDRTRNPDGLPIGFVRDSPSKSGARCEFVGMSCAACHTARFGLGGKHLFVDGAPTSANMWAFLSELRLSLHDTAADAGKLAAFAAQLPAEERDGGRCLLDRKQQTLAQDLQRFSDHLGVLLAPKGDETASKGWGPARLDAVGVITNQIFLHLDQAEKVVSVDAPVSYPFLWDTHQHNQVQWNGVSTLPLTRNIVEVMGVFSDYGPELKGWWPFKRYDSTVRVDGLRTLEDRVKTLRSPRWPTDLVGSGIDPGLKERGRILFEQKKCADCHSHVPRDESVPSIKAIMTPVSLLKTDPMMAENFASTGAAQRADCSKGPLKSPPLEGILGQESPRVVGGLLVFLFREIPELLRAAVPPLATWDRCAYKGRPLDGIWATAPYLHNGSVPNLDELLKPSTCAAGDSADKCRVKSFCVSIEPKLDARQVGVPSGAALTSCPPGDFLFDTTLPGNSNAGHEGAVYGFPISDSDRKALIEYQKSL
jgi:hypothetical protein